MGTVVNLVLPSLSEKSLEIWLTVPLKMKLFHRKYRILFETAENCILEAIFFKKKRFQKKMRGRILIFHVMLI